MGQQTGGREAVKWGLIFGVIVGLISVLQSLVPYVVADQLSASLIAIAVFVGYLILYFLAGMLTARRVGSTGSGAFAGLLAGIIATAVGGIINIAIIALNPGAYARASGLESLNAPRHILVALAFAGLLRGVLVHGSFGAALGALGGLVGRSGHRSGMVTTNAMPPHDSPVGYPAQPSGGVPHSSQ
jgi:hypothetical protein